MIFNNKRFSFDQVEESEVVTEMNVFIIFVIKTLNLKLIMRSRIIITSLLKFNESKSFKR